MSYLQRYDIRGPKDLIEEIKRRNFYFSPADGVWKSRGLFDDPARDPLEDMLPNHLVMDSPDTISFSAYVDAGNTNEESVTEMARNLPEGITLSTVGFDIEDYPLPGQMLVVYGGTGEIYSNVSVPAELLVDTYFPEAAEDLSFLMRSNAAVARANRMAETMANSGLVIKFASLQQDSDEFHWSLAPSGDAQGSYTPAQVASLIAIVQRADPMLYSTLATQAKIIMNSVLGLFLLPARKPNPGRLSQ